MDDLEDALARIDWGSTFRRLALYAKRKLGGVPFEEAEDIAADAIRQVLDPEYRNWDPRRETLLWHLQSNVNGLVANRLRKKSRTQEQLRDFQAQPVGDAVENVVADEEAGDRLHELSNYAIARGDDLGAQIVVKALEGIVSPREVALALGVSSQQVYDARQRLKRYARVLRSQRGEQ